MPPPPPGGVASLVAKRLTFGINAQVTSDLTSMGTAAWIEDQLSKTGPDPQVENMLSGYQLLKATKLEVRTITGSNNELTLRELSQATVVRARYSRHQLYEQMCMLWSDHFNAVVTGSGALQHLQVDYNEKVIRPHAMGKFVDLLVANAHSACMLTYLDNYKSNANSAAGVNENYGRELLELHTLGIHADGTQVYTEADVKTASLVMSGWSVKTSSGTGQWDFQYVPTYHSTAAASILGGQWTYPAHTQANGKAAGDSLLQFLARHPSTARYVARRILTRFVSDNPSTALVNSTATVYLNNDTAIVPVLRHVFASSEFRQSYGAKLRRPFEFMIAAMRATEATVAADPTTTAADRLRVMLREMGNGVWGWATPDGYPDTADHWTSSDGILQRWKIGAELVRGILVANNTPAVTVNVRTLVGNAATLGAATSALAARFGVYTLSTQTRDSMIAALGRQPGEATSGVPDTVLAQIAGFLLAHTDAQHR